MKINLVEEWKLYETMWDESRQEDPVQQILNKASDIEFEFGGFSRDRFKDKWSHTTGHYTKDWTDRYDNFTYMVDAITVFEDIRDKMIPKYIDKVEQSPLIIECKKVFDAWNNSTPETEAKTGEIFDLFIANNLEALAEVFNNQLKEEYEEEAENWAEENIEPSDYWPD
jgi:hypothetical protein